MVMIKNVADRKIEPNGGGGGSLRDSPRSQWVEGWLKETKAAFTIPSAGASVGCLFFKGWAIGVSVDGVSFDIALWRAARTASGQSFQSG